MWLCNLNNISQPVYSLTNVFETSPIYNNLKLWNYQMQDSNFKSKHRNKNLFKINLATKEK